MSNKQDMIVAEKVLGWGRGSRWGNGNGGWTIDGEPYEKHLTTWDNTPKFSSSMDAAMQVRDAIRKMPFSVRMRFKRALGEVVNSRVGANIDPSEIILFISANDICLAALRAVEKDGD